MKVKIYIAVIMTISLLIGLMFVPINNNQVDAYSDGFVPIKVTYTLESSYSDYDWYTGPTKAFYDNSNYSQYFANIKKANSQNDYNYTLTSNEYTDSKTTIKSYEYTKPNGVESDLVKIYKKNSYKYDTTNTNESTNYLSDLHPIYYANNTLEDSYVTNKTTTNSIDFYSVIDSGKYNIIKDSKSLNIYMYEPDRDGINDCTTTETHNLDINDKNYNYINARVLDLNKYLIYKDTKAIQKDSDAADALIDIFMHYTKWNGLFNAVTKKRVNPAKNDEHPSTNEYYSSGNISFQNKICSNSITPKSTICDKQAIKILMKDISDNNVCVPYLKSTNDIKVNRSSDSNGSITVNFKAAKILSNKNTYSLTNNDLCSVTFNYTDKIKTGSTSKNSIDTFKKAKISIIFKPNYTLDTLIPYDLCYDQYAISNSSYDYTTSDSNDNVFNRLTHYIILDSNDTTNITDSISTLFDSKAKSPITATELSNNATTYLNEYYDSTNKKTYYKLRMDDEELKTIISNKNSSLKQNLNTNVKVYWSKESVDFKNILKDTNSYSKFPDELTIPTGSSTYINNNIKGNAFIPLTYVNGFPQSVVNKNKFSIDPNTSKLLKDKDLAPILTGYKLNIVYIDNLKHIRVDTYSISANGNNLGFRSNEDLKLPTTQSPTTSQPSTSKPTTETPSSTEKPTTETPTTTEKPSTTEKPTTKPTTETPSSSTTEKPTTTEQPTTEKPTTTESPTKPTTEKPTTTETPTTEKPNTTESPNQPSFIKVTNISLNNTSITLNVNDSYKLNVTILPANASNKNVIWRSNNSTIVSVSDNGLIKGLKNGTATITATSVGNASIYASCKVIVNKNSNSSNTTEQPSNTTSPNTPSLKLDKSNYTTITGKTFMLNYNLHNYNKPVTWKSSNKKIAIVLSNGKIKTIKPGKVTITCSTSDNKLSSKCTITVKQAVTSIKLPKSIKIKKNKSVKLKPKFNAKAYNKKVSWKSSNKKIATISSKGVLKGKKVGKVTITCIAKDGSNTKSKIKVIVKK